MPCRDYGPSAVEMLQAEQKRLNRITALLCSLMKGLEADNILEKYSTPAHDRWWRRHKKEDAKRIAKEEAEASAKKKLVKALSKLSDEDIKTLGLSSELKRVKKELKKGR